MNSNRFILILGLLLIMILSIGSIAAAEEDSIDESITDLGLTDDGGSVESIDSSNIDDVNAVNAPSQGADSSSSSLDSNYEEEIDSVAMESNEESDDSSGEIEIGGKDEKAVDAKNSLKSSNLASTITFKESSYSTYFNSTGGIISGKLKSGDTLDFSGKFTKKTFIINIPLIITSSDGTANLINCNFTFCDGSDGSTISNLKANNTITDNPIFQIYNVVNMKIMNNNLFSSASHSYPITCNNVNRSSIFNNRVQTTANSNAPSALVFRGSYYNNITDNIVITNDSNGIYFTAYGASGAIEGGSDSGGGFNYIFNNTVYSVRQLPSSFTYGISLMSNNNTVLNNTIFNTFRAVYADGSGNQIIGNNISNIHGSYYSTSTVETGADNPIYAGMYSLVEKNNIYDCILSSTGAAIYADYGSLIKDNTLKNISGWGADLANSNITFIQNNLNVTGFGVHILGDLSGIYIGENIIDSGNQSAICLERQSKMAFPNNILIENNYLYSTNEAPIKIDEKCQNITTNNNIIIGGHDPDEGDENESSIHVITESNFYDFFSVTGYMNDKVKENDTVLFSGTFSSKGKVYINNKVNIKGINAQFIDTTFIIMESDVYIDKLNIYNPNENNLDRLWGIQINNVSNVTIANSNISIFDPYSAFAIYVLDSSDCNILNNTLEARGNYFTVAILSFNSHDIYIDGNSLKTIGTGETYLVNNKSCIDGYLKIYADIYDGSIVCPDGYTICPDGSLLCPDGVTTIAAEDYTVCVDGTVICADGSIICPDGSLYEPGEYEQNGDFIICPDGTTVCTDGSLICTDGTMICPDGSIVCTDGTTICPDGSIICPDGSVYGPGEYETAADGSIICPDGTTICPDGTIVCTDGSIVCPDGSVSSNILDGVIPGSHMVSGVYRTYGFLMIHSSNVNFTNNIVNVSSALGADYDLNESYNTIAGVFVHYGGFNNNISNNLIVLDSNDPIIYGIGVIGAPSNSTAVGSVNNTFSNNNLTINGPYLAVGVLLGNKAVNSSIAYNRFSILSGRPSPNIVNYNESAGNTFIDNEFDNKVKTVFEFENISADLKDLSGDGLLYEITFKDISGNALNNKTISIGFNGAVSNITTDENGKASLMLKVNDAGVYDILISFDGDDGYFPASSTAKLTVKAYTSLIVSNVSYKTSDGNKIITATLKDENGKPLINKLITFTVNGVKYTAKTNSQGKVAIKLSLTAGGTYAISASFAGDSTYYKSSGSGKLTLTKVASKLTSSGKTYSLIAKSKAITITLKDASEKALSGKKVTATVNGKTYSAKTNAKGVATIKLTLSKVKTFSVSLKFAGDAMYSASTKSIKVKITKAKTKITVPNKKYKANAKVKKLTATLKDANGKVLKSKKVKFTVKGKTYSANTNKKGVVTVKVKLAKKGTYKFTVKFPGDSSYLAVTKKAKLILN